MPLALAQAGPQVLFVFHLALADPVSHLGQKVGLVLIDEVPHMQTVYLDVLALKVGAPSAIQASCGSPCVAVPYCETSPQRLMRACRLSSGSTAVNTWPPTFSKYASIPAGQAALRSSARGRALVRDTRQTLTR